MVVYRQDITELLDVIQYDPDPEKYQNKIPDLIRNTSVVWCRVLTPPFGVDCLALLQVYGGPSIKTYI
jgi:hypothetical protein